MDQKDNWFSAHVPTAKCSCQGRNRKGAKQGEELVENR